MLTHLKSLIVGLMLLFLLSGCGPASSRPGELPVRETIPPAAPVALPSATSPQAATPTTLAVGDPANGALMFQARHGPDRTSLVLVDVTNGAVAGDRDPLEFPSAGSYIYLPGFDTLAMVAYSRNDNPTQPRLVLLDIARWQTREVALPLSGWAGALAASPDGTRIAVASYGLKENLAVVDTGQMVVRAAIHGPGQVRALSFSQDGSALLLYSNNTDWSSGASLGAPQALALDGADLSTIWQAELPGVRDGFFPAPDFDGQAHEPGAGTWLNPGVVFSPVADTLFVAHADEDRLTRVDFGAQEVTSMEVRPRLGLLERLLSLGASIAHAKMLDGTMKSAAISADGETLYIAGVDSQVTNKETGRFDLVQRPLGLQVVEAATATELSSLDTQAAQVSVLPDGLVLLLSTAGDAPLTEVYDPATQRIATRYDGLYQECLPLAGGGYVLAPALFYYELGIPSVAIYDARSTEPLASWELSHRESQWVQGCAP